MKRPNLGKCECGKPRLQTRMMVNCSHSLFECNCECKYCVEADRKSEEAEE